MKLSHKAQVNNQDHFQNAWVQFKLGCDMQSLIGLRFCYPKGLHKYMGALFKQFAQTSKQSVLLLHIRVCGKSPDLGDGMF